MSDSCQLTSTACHCHTCDIFVTAPCHSLVTVTSLSRFFRDKVVTVTSVSRFFRDKDVTVTTLSHFFKLRGVAVTCHTCDTTVTSLSRLVCHYPVISVICSCIETIFYLKMLSEILNWIKFAKKNVPKTPLNASPAVISTILNALQSVSEPKLPVLTVSLILEVISL